MGFDPRESKFDAMDTCTASGAGCSHKSECALASNQLHKPSRIRFIPVLPVGFDVATAIFDSDDK